MKRDEQIARLGESWDVLIIGGGATGLGVAVDSAARGYRTLLVEARDFAQCTSSRSTKLVHGGVRYLQQGNIKLVREALHERELLLLNAPHLACECRFLVPAYAWWEKPFYGIGLKVYDYLAGRTRMEGSRLVGARGAKTMIPTLEGASLRGGVLYSDGQFDDTRLAMSLMRTAEAHGAALVNDVAVTELHKSQGRITGAKVVDATSGRSYDLRARCVVNATGPFTDTIRRMDDPKAAAMMAVSQGVHLILDRSFLPGHTAILVPRTPDGRVIFIIPWHDRTLVGTTDTPMDGPVVEPAPLDSEVDFILDLAGRYLTRKPSRSDVLCAFAGLRPLVKSQGMSTAALSRDHTLLVSRSGLVTITGGKWTTYRRMAEDTVDRAARVAGLPEKPCSTGNLRLHGWDCQNERWKPFGATPAEIADYEARYPGDLHPNLPYSLAMAAYTIDHEMPQRLDDVLSRRMRALLLDAAAAVEAAPRVAELMARLQGHDAAWVKKEVEDFELLARKHLLKG